MSESHGDPFNTQSTITASSSHLGQLEEYSPWGGLILDPVGRWWLERNVLVPEKQTMQEGGLVLLRLARRVERLGPFATEDEARGYRNALEGK